MLQEFEKKLRDIIDLYKEKIKTIGVEKVSPSLLSDIKVITSDTNMPIKALATINVIDDRTLEVKPWDLYNRGFIEFSLSKCSLLSGVVSQKDKIICSFPNITAEERKKLTKYLGEYTESIKISLRTVRQKHIDHIKSQKLSQDNEK
jgi:ribosome recycling factor